MARLAILAGKGALPHLIAAAHPDALFVHFDGGAVDLPKNQTLSVSYERFGEIFAGLHAGGVTQVVFAGGLVRPELNPAHFDARMMQLAPGFMAAMAGGDDKLLRAVISAFESEGFGVKGAHEVLPELTVQPGTLCASLAPSGRMQNDADYGKRILDALGGLDITQSCVVANGMCLGIETAQGTEALLGFVRDTRRGLRSAKGGVLIKRPKTNQDMRIDMPTIGPDTVYQARDAGLDGICVQAGTVIVLDIDEVRNRSKTSGVAVWATAE